MNTIQYGSTGPEVGLLQKYLSLKVDNRFGRLTHEAVVAFQKSHSLTSDGIVGPKTWAVLKTSYDMSVLPQSNITIVRQGEAIPTLSNGKLNLLKTKRKVNDIILHCTATREGQDWSVAQIKAMHQRQNGWADIAYHYVITLDGEIRVGRDVNYVGAHCQGHNTGSIGISYVGGCPADTVKKAKDTRTPKQKESMIKLVRQLLSMYNLTPKNVHGHCEYSSKSCPSFDMKEFRGQL